MKPYDDNETISKQCPCGNSASHKVEDVTPGASDWHHPFTQCLCCVCFGNLFGSVAKEECEAPPRKRLVSTLKELTAQIEQIVNADIPWETKYDLIFSKELSGSIRDLGINLDYYDPDSSYKDDVLAYFRALNHKTKELNQLAVATSRAGE